MNLKDPRAKGCNWLMPYLTVSNVAESLKTYVAAFGFEAGPTLPGEDGSILHGEVRYQGATLVMFGPEGAWGSRKLTPRHGGFESPTGLYVYCDDVDSRFQQAVDAGLRAISPPHDMFWGDRTACVEDHDGYQWTLATHIVDFDPSQTPPPF